MDLPAAATPVTLRHRLPGSGPPVFADVVGTVVVTDPTGVRLRRGDGSEVAVGGDRIVAWRPLPTPPGPGRPVASTAVERLAAAGWPAPETERLGGWLLRAAGGWTRRANSVLALGDPGMALPAAVAACTAWYAARGLPVMLSVVTADLTGERADGRVDSRATGSAGQLAGELAGGVAGELAGELAGLGWRPGVRTIVLVARAADVLAGWDGGRAAAGVVTLDDRPSHAWLADYLGGGPRPVADAVLTGPTAPARVRFAGVVDPADGERLLARGRAVTLGGWTGLTAVAVAPPARRGGTGRATVAALLLDGLRHGGVRSYVQVEADNTGGHAFWRRLGYRESHRTCYFRPPS